MIRRRYISWIVPLLILVILAGGAGVASQAAGQATAARTEAVGTPVAAPTFGPGSFNLDPTSGLTDLSSYQAMLKVDFQGKPNPWTETLTLLASGKPSVRALTAMYKGNAPAAAYVVPWSATMNGVYYWQDSDGACIGSTAQTNTDPATPPLVWEPAAFLPGVIGAEEAGAKTVNGVTANGYKFDERALGLAGNATGTGEVWVADTGGYVVEYSLTLKGGADYFGEGGDGTLTWTYDVTKVGQPAAITLLKDCPSGLVDAPVMKDAQNVQQLPGATVYTTPSTVAQVADFYQKQLPATGWKLNGKPGIGAKAGFLTFKQGTSQLTVLIQAGDKGTVVQIVLASVQ